MKQICNDECWAGMESALINNGDPDNPGKPCYKQFDDAEQSTVYPHKEL